MDNWVIRQECDLARPERTAGRVMRTALMVPGDHQAHVWEIAVTRGGEPVTLSGSAKCYLAASGADETIVVNGAISENVARFIFPQEAYARQGLLRAVARMTQDPQVVTLADVVFTVGPALPDQYIDPGEVIPTIDDLLEQLGTMQALNTSLTGYRQKFDGIEQVLGQATEHGKNLWMMPASATFAGNSGVLWLPVSAPAGRYTLSAEIVTTAETESCRATVTYTDGTTKAVNVGANTGARGSGSWEAQKDIASVTLYANGTPTSSAGYTATWSDIQLEAGSAATAYEPYTANAVDAAARTACVRYVATSGSDTNSGLDAAHPLKTINAALDAGARTVFISTGTYAEKINRSGLHGLTLARIGTGGAIGGVYITSDSGTAVNLTDCKDIRFHGIGVSVGDGGTNAMKLTGCSGVLEQCSIGGGSHALNLVGCAMELRGCVMKGSAANGLYLNTTEGSVRVEDCIFAVGDAMKYGIRATTVWDICVSGCAFDGLTKCGISIEGGAAAMVCGSRFSGCGASTDRNGSGGFFLMETTELAPRATSVTGCAFADNAGKDIYVGATGVIDLYGNGRRNTVGGGGIGSGSGAVINQLNDLRPASMSAGGSGHYDVEPEPIPEG